MARIVLTLIAFLGLPMASFGQNVTLSLGWGSGSAGGTTALPLNLVSSGESKPAAIQWSFSYPADVSGVTVVVAASATNAGKSISCSGNKCLISGLTKDAMGDGTIATATFRLAGKPSAKTIPIQIVNVIASTASGVSIPASGGLGVVSLH